MLNKKIKHEGIKTPAFFWFFFLFFLFCDILQSYSSGKTVTARACNQKSQRLVLRHTVYFSLHSKSKLFEKVNWTPRPGTVKTSGEPNMRQTIPDPADAELQATTVFHCCRRSNAEIPKISQRNWLWSSIKFQGHRLRPQSAWGI